MSRLIAATAILVAATAVLVGCTEEKDPEPQWTEKSAYAAAEETFRAYWAAGVQSSGARIGYLTTEMQEVERAGDKELKELGVELRGASKVESAQFINFRQVGDKVVVELSACIDGSEVEVRRDGGEWSSPREDPSYQVEVQLESNDETMLIADLTESEDDEC